MLNSSWDKFGQSGNQPRRFIVNQPAEFFAMISDLSINMSTVLPVNDNTIIVNWEFKYDCYDPLSKRDSSCPFKLGGDRVLYYDTDTVKTSDIPGRFIGDMSNKIKCIK